MSLATTTRLVRTLKELMANLTEVERHVHEDLSVYTWRPNVPLVPCIWNWLDQAPWEQMDLGRQRDNFTVIAVLAVAHGDNQETMDVLTDYVDAFRETIDPALFTSAPLGCKEAHRLGMRMAEQTFGGENGTSYLSVEFPLLCKMDRHIERS